MQSKRILFGNIIDSVKPFCHGHWSDIANLQNAVNREILGKSYWPDQKNRYRSRKFITTKIHNRWLSNSSSCPWRKGGVNTRN